MDNSNRIGFQQIMFAYSLEEVSNPTELMVTIPDVFIDKITSTADSLKVLKGTTTIFRNVTPPALSNYYLDKNYIRLPVIEYFGGSSNVVGPSMIADGNVLKINSSQPTNYPLNVGIGNVKIGDKLLVAFVNSNPTMGMIIARCR